MEPQTETEKTQNGEMSFDAFKKALGPAALKYTDAQIEAMRRICDGIADACFNSWLQDRKAHNDVIQHEPSNA